MRISFGLEANNKINNSYSTLTQVFEGDMVLNLLRIFK